MTANGSRGSVAPFVGAHYSDAVRYGGSVAAFTWGGGVRPPVAGFTATPLSGVAPLTVTFTNTTTGRVTGYQWDFGDQTTSVVTHPVHIYTASGVYTVSLTASGPGGSDTLTRTNYITVESGAEYTAHVITYTYDPLSRLTGASTRPVSSSSMPTMRWAIAPPTPSRWARPPSPPTPTTRPTA